MIQSPCQTGPLSVRTVDTQNNGKLYIILLMVSYINGKFQVTNDHFLSINKQQLKSSVFEEFLQRFLFLFSVCSSFWYT